MLTCSLVHVQLPFSIPGPAVYGQCSSQRAGIFYINHQSRHCLKSSLKGQSEQSISSREVSSAQVTPDFYQVDHKHKLVQRQRDEYLEEGLNLCYHRTKIFLKLILETWVIY